MQLIPTDEATDEIYKEAIDRVDGARDSLTGAKLKLRGYITGDNPTTSFTEELVTDMQEKRQELDDALEWFGEVLLARNNYQCEAVMTPVRVHTVLAINFNNLLRDGCTLDALITYQKELNAWRDEVYKALREYGMNTTFTVGE